MQFKFNVQLFSGNLVSWIFVLICFSYPIPAVLSLIFGLPNTIVNASYRALVLLLCLPVFFALISNRSKINKSSIVLIAFLVLYILRVIWDKIILKVESEHSNLEIFSFLIGNIFCPVLAISLGFKYANLEITIKRIFYALIFSNLLIFFYFLMQINWEISPTTLLERAGIKGEAEDSNVVNPITFGFFGASLFIFSFIRLLIFKKNVSRFLFFILLITLIIGLINLVIGNSRGPVLASLLSFLVLFRFYVLSEISFKRKIYKFLPFGIITAFLLGYVLVQIQSDDNTLGILVRFSKMKEDFDQGEIDERSLLYQEAFNMFKDYPLLGNQFVVESSGIYPHNAFLEVMMSLGLVGLFLYVLILISFFGKIFYFLNYSEYIKVFIGLAIASLTLTMTTGNLYQSVENWSLLAAVLSFSKISNENKI